MRATLPYPPSANRYWRVYRGRPRPSAEAKAFKAAVGLQMRAAKATPAEGPLSLTVHVFRPQKRGDLDNTLKALCDALNGYAWHDDSQVVEIHAHRHDDKAQPRVEVLVEASKGAEPLSDAGRAVSGDLKAIPEAVRNRRRQS